MSANASKNFLITGAARGIGRGLSRLLLHNGHRVFLVDINTVELINTHSNLAKTHRSNEDFKSQEVDLRHPPSITEAVEGAKNFFNGKLDVLINNAADTSAVGKSPLSALTLEEWNTSLAINLTAPMLLSQACLPLLQRSASRDSGGCIINMSSTRALMAEPNNESYSATKAGLLGFTQSLAVSLAPHGVRVNAILPGWIHVGDECAAADQSGRGWEEGLSREDHEWHLTGRVGKVEDVFRAVEYLVQAEGVSGAEMVVDGGVGRKMVYPGD
ncbi:hypothetical protein LTR62_004167 [Meristemomyces frigidus]|uniref:Uncharacterized protein n=1 Tax=Meristemomyces frigidus TaxID=1508187 RepID=A0AAN7TRR2_9PEZI|nr:hypothetical protein LTR62_004167 [Meristemomyces frigidus]